MQARYIYDTVQDTLLAVLLVGADEGMTEPGIEFFTTPEHPLQLGRMLRDKGYQVPSHYHVEAPRAVLRTAEVLFVRRGHIRLGVCGMQAGGTMSEDRQVTDLHTGDVALLLAGWHDLEFLEASELWEVKNGPYLGDGDKKRLSTTKPQEEANP